MNHSSRHHATLVIVNNPFRPSDHRTVRAIPRRRRIADLAPTTASPFICLHNGQPLMRAEWRRTRVKRGDIVSFILLPQGGGGGGSNPLKMLMMIALTYFTMGAGASLWMGELAGSVTGSLLGLAANMAGTALINAVLPPPKPPATHQAAQLAAPSPTYSVNAQGNIARLGAAIPVLYGRHIIYPDFAAQPFSEFIANEQYLYLLFCLGQGEMQIEQVRFDKTDATAYGGDVLQEVVPPGNLVTLFPVNVVTSSEVAGQEIMGRKDLTYSQTGTVLTVTEAAHGRTLNSVVKLSVTSGTAVSGEYLIAGITLNDWTVTMASTATTSGNVQVYSYLGGQGFVANAAGTLANFICVDVAMPQGLGIVNVNGGIDVLSVKFYAEAQPIDANGNATGAWQMLPPRYPATPIHFIDTITQPKAASWSVPDVIASLPLTRTGLNAASIIIKRAGVTISGWTHSIGTGAGGMDEILIPALYQKNYSPTATVSWTAEYTINTAIFEEQFNGATNTPQRRSLLYRVTPGRYRVRVSRTDIKNTASNAMHSLNWIAMEAYLPGVQNYGNVTLLAVRIRASAMTAGAAQKVNVIATRCLPTLPLGATVWSDPQPTQSIAWAIADAARAQYGGKLLDAQLDIEALRLLDEAWLLRGDTFNGVFDNAVTLWEAVTSLARAGRAKPYLLGGVLKLARDEARQTPVALFSMRNIEKSSFAVDYAFPNEATTDSVEMTYFDEAVWAQRTVMCTLPGGTANNPAKLTAFGMTDRDQAHREGIYSAACNRYRRKTVRLRSEMEGFIPVYGDLLAVQHDIPGWGQHGEVIAYDMATGELTLSEALVWTPGATHYLGLRNRNGSLTDAVEVTQGSGADKVVMNVSPPVDYLDMGGDRERTHVSFGAGESWRQTVICTQTTPRGLNSVEITCANENQLVHTLETQVPTPPWVGW